MNSLEQPTYISDFPKMTQEFRTKQLYLGQHLQKAHSQILAYSSPQQEKGKLEHKERAPVQEAVVLVTCMCRE